MIPIGSDIHKRRCNFMKFEDGKVRALPPIDNTREAWLEFLSELPPEAEIAMEVSTSSYFTMRVREEAGWSQRVIRVHSAGIDSPRKQKNDRLDATRLARKLAVNHLEPLPQAWFPPLQIRPLRLRTRQRCWLAVWRGQAKNRVQGLLPMHGLRPPGSDPFGVEGRKWVGRQSLPTALQESAEQLLRLIDRLGQEIELSEKRLQAVEASYPEIALLDTLPGVGPLLAAVILGRGRRPPALPLRRGFGELHGVDPQLVSERRGEGPGAHSPARVRPGCAGR